MKKFTFLITVLISVLNINAENDLWPNEAINTGVNATYLVSGDTDVTFNGQDFIYGKLGAFYTDDNNELQNGGWILWNDAPNNFSVQGDDSTTPEKDGFVDGEEITWLATNDGGTTTYIASVAYTVGPAGMGSNNYVGNGINIMAEFTISNTEYCVNDADNDGICDENETAGCTDSLAINYNSDAEVDDGSCITAIPGCTDENADNYNPEANTDDGSCSIAGCMNEIATNYNPEATVDDGECIIEGCTDATAFNYSSVATSDDNSCLSAVNIEYDSVIVTSSTTVFNIVENSISLSLGDSVINSEDIIGAFQIINNELVCVGFSNWGDEDISIELVEDDLNTTEVDGYVSTEPIYWIATQDNSGVNYLLEVTINEANNFITEITLNTNVTLGCTVDANAINYNPDSGVIEDGSCTDAFPGCTDENADNYNPDANTDDGSCIFLSINDLTDNKIILYPNPVNSIINIISNNSDIHSFELYNCIGELVISISDINSKLITISRNELNSGIYISKITDTDGNTVVRNIIFE
ncbi:MAG: T9SS type A sorting domain-containing protein [Flavobacteriales bacterium]